MERASRPQTLYALFFVIHGHVLLYCMYMMSGPKYMVQRYVSASPDSSTLTVLPSQASPCPPFLPFRLPDAASDQRLVVAI